MSEQFSNQSSMLNRIRNNNFINVSKLTPMIIKDIGTFSPDAQRYLRLPTMILGTHEVRARLGNFRNPWMSPVPDWYAPYPFKFSSVSLADVTDKRSLEMIEVAKKTNREIIIMWSGGIDSTLMLTSFLKNIPQADLELITVACTYQSIADNTEFYIKYLSKNKKIRLMNMTDLVTNNRCLDKYLVLHGDPADGLFGPSAGMYKYFLDRGQHLETWKKHFLKMSELIEPRLETDGFVYPGLGKWYCDIVSRTLDESGQSDYISTVADFWWWNYFNFKWHVVSMLPLFSTLLDEWGEGITLQNQKFYAENLFFGSADFQHWSYTNLKELVGLDFHKTSKLKPREYIYDFDKNFRFFSRKRKTGVANPTQKMQKGGIIGYDSEFKPLNFGNRTFRQVIDVLLKRYQI